MTPAEVIASVLAEHEDVSAFGPEAVAVAGEVLAALAEHGLAVVAERDPDSDCPCAEHRAERRRRREAERPAVSPPTDDKEASHG